jgi:murein DD-endopeptidase MepM/ murein hydrolase activator NlpD
MFVPEDNGKSFSLRVHKFVLKSLIIFIFLFILGMIILLSKSGEIAAKLQLLHVIRTENAHLTQENEQLRQISEALEKIEVLSQYIERLAVQSKLQDTIEVKEIEGKVPFNIFGKKQYSKNLSSKYSNQTNSIADRFSSIPNVLPVEGWITRQFSSDVSQIYHQGIDFAAAEGTPIRATAFGVIEEVAYDKSYGLIVTVRHDHGFITKYGHCSQVLVSKNQNVNRGQTIAFVGNTGRSTGPHLHYEVIKEGKNVNPANYLLVRKE